MKWIRQEEILFFFLLVGTVVGIDSGSGSLQFPMLDSQLSTLLMQLQEEVEALEQEKMRDKERIFHLEQITDDLVRRVSLLESVCSTADIWGEEEVSKPTNVSSASKESRPILAIGGHNYNDLSSAEVLNTSCDFPLPMSRWDHMSVTTADGKTLVCGGQIPSWPGIITSCLQFDYESKSWKEHSTLRFNRGYGISVTLSSGTYMMGGDKRDQRSSSDFLATGSSVWTQGPHIPGKGVYYSCAAKLSDTEFVILGGYYDQTQARVYDVLSEEWREWPRLTVAVYGQSCMGLGDILLMAGGQIGGVSDGTTTGRTVIFDTKTGSAREVASLKYPRKYASMVLYGGKLVILGGTDGSVERSDGEMWNMDTETWEEADIHLNIARAKFSLVTMAEEIDCD